jgi:hypothetical protein
MSIPRPGPAGTFTTPSSPVRSEDVAHENGSASSAHLPESTGPANGHNPGPFNDVVNSWFPRTSRVKRSTTSSSMRKRA